LKSLSNFHAQLLGFLAIGLDTLRNCNESNESLEQILTAMPNRNFEFGAAQPTKLCKAKCSNTGPVGNLGRLPVTAAGQANERDRGAIEF
jgi:hypothetical protein